MTIGEILQRHEALVDLQRLQRSGRLLLHEVDELGHAEEADDDDQEVDAGEDVGNAEGVAGNARIGVDADRGEHQADDGGEQRLHRVGADQRGERGEGEDHQRHIVRRREVDRVGGERRAEEAHQDDGEGAADEGRDGRQGERLAGLAVAGHRIAVQRRHHRAGVAGHVEQDRRDAAAIFGAVIDAGEQDDRRFRLEAEAVGDRQEDRDAVDRADAGQGADQRAGETAGEHEEEVEGVERDFEAGSETRDDSVHNSAHLKIVRTPAGRFSSSSLVQRK